MEGKEGCCQNILKRINNTWKKHHHQSTIRMRMCYKFVVFSLYLSKGKRRLFAYRKFPRTVTKRIRFWACASVTWSEKPSILFHSGESMIELNFFLSVMLTKYTWIIQPEKTLKDNTGGACFWWISIQNAILYNQKHTPLHCFFCNLASWECVYAKVFALENIRIPHKRNTCQPNSHNTA